MKIRNMTSSRGNEIANQFEIEDGNSTYFQSYNSIIVKRGALSIEESRNNPEIKDWKLSRTYLDKNYWNYSTTTGKYRNIFLGEDRKETERKINAGTYKLVNLN